MSVLGEIARSARLVVWVGPGGVGKTTSAAALAVREACAGRRVFLLTIDPARRLADALSISLDDAEHEVALPRGAGALHAAMLDTRASWDAFVARVAEDPGARERIRANRVYQAFSRTLARSHAYVAMERLHHVLAERDETGRPCWDLVVLDTPPTRSALDVLDAPASLSRFVDERVVGALVSSGASALRAPGTLAARRVLGWIMGERLAGELFGFLEAFAPLRAGFAARARAVEAALMAETTAFVLVSAPHSASGEDASFLARDLARRGIELSALVVNRAFHTDPLRPGQPLDRGGPRWEEARARAVLAAAPGGGAREAALVVDALGRARRRAIADDTRAEAAVSALAAMARARRTIVLPALPSEPCTPEALLQLAEAARAAGLSARGAAAR